jgi:hypothetical protein
MISCCLDKILRDPCCYVTCISTKIEDVGHFIPFDQNICTSKQDMKNGKRVLYVVLNVLSNRKIKIYCHFPLKIQQFLPHGDY